MQQSRLPTVRVADDGHHREGAPPATLAPQRPLLADLLDVFIELADAVTDAPPIAFQFLLARAARPDACAQPGQVAPAHKPRQQMMQLRGLDLQTSLLGARPLGKNIEGQVGPVEHLDLESSLQISLLAW